MIKVRHSSWNHAAVLDVLESWGIGICNIDQPLRGRALKPAAHATSGIGYVRLYGRDYQNWFADKGVAERYHHLYSPSEIEPWADRIKNVAGRIESRLGSQISR